MKVTLALFALSLLTLLAPLVSSVPVSAAEYQWTQVIESPSPSARRSHAMAFDPSANKIVLFGGFANGSHLGDTWIFAPDTEEWRQVGSGQAPTPRAAANLVYEPLHERLILFGGFGFGHSLVTNDTWAFDVNSSTWLNLEPENSPSERASYGFAGDSMRDLLVLFGGFTEQGYFNDLWAYSPEENSWVEIEAKGEKPAPRGAMGFVYDEANDVFVMYGGFSNSGFFGDTWIFDPNAGSWTEMKPNDHPPPLRTRMVYSNETSQSIFFGGDVIYPDTDEVSVEPYGSVWAYDYRKNAWQDLTPSRSDGVPEKRSLNGIAYDPQSASIVIFGGTDTLIDNTNFVGREFGDTWVLASYGAEPVSLPVLFDAGSASGTVLLITIIGASGAVVATVVFIRKNRRKAF